MRFGNALAALDCEIGPPEWVKRIVYIHLSGDNAFNRPESETVKPTFSSFSFDCFVPFQVSNSVNSSRQRWCSAKVDLVR